MPVTREEIESFQRFAEAELARGKTAFTMEELLDLWRVENPSPEQFEEDVAAVQAALRELDRGERGIPIDEFLAEVRAKYRLPNVE